MKRSLSLIAIFLSCFLFFSTAQAVFTFQINNVGPFLQYSQFIGALRTLFTQPSSSSIMTVTMTNDGGPNLLIRMRMNDLYITHINNIPITPENYPPNTPQITIQTVNNAYRNGLRFTNNTPPLQRRQYMQILAFVIAEATRFAEIENAVNQVFNGGAAVPWINFEDRMHNWMRANRIYQQTWNDIPITRPLSNQQRSMFVGITAALWVYYLNRIAVPCNQHPRCENINKCRVS